MEKIDDLVNKRIAEYIDNLKEYNWTREKVYTILYDFKIDNPQKIYVVTGRTKEAKSLKEKLVNRYRDKLLDKKRSEKIEHLVKDLVGLRIVCYYKQDLKDLDGFIRNKFDLSPADIPEIYTFGSNDVKSIFTGSNNRDIELGILNEDEEIYLNEKGSGEKRFKIKTKDSKYTGIHYTVYLKRAELKEHPKIPVEIQLRTMLQEAWGELEHDISYKYPKVDVQEFFQPISQNLQASDDLINRIKQKVVDKSNMFINFLKKYYPEEKVAKSEEDILLLLRKKELDKAKETIEDLFNRVGEPFLKILEFDIKRDALKTIIDSMDVHKKNEILNKLKTILFRICLKNIIETKQYHVETIKGILKSISPENALEVLNTTPLGELQYEVLFELDVFLKEVWMKEEPPLLIKIIDILFGKGELWNRIKREQRDHWKDVILNYIKTRVLPNGIDVIKHFKPSMEKYDGLSVDTSFKEFIGKVKQEALKKDSTEINKVFCKTGVR
jgi:ppGpp synthetase/RelA/SpoT-type nucleotidyltranferase